MTNLHAFLCSNVSVRSSVPMKDTVGKFDSLTLPVAVVGGALLRLAQASVQCTLVGFDHTAPTASLNWLVYADSKRRLAR